MKQCFVGLAIFFWEHVGLAMFVMLHIDLIEESRWKWEFGRYLLSELRTLCVWLSVWPIQRSLQLDAHEFWVLWLAFYYRAACGLPLFFTNSATNSLTTNMDIIIEYLHKHVNYFGEVTRILWISKLECLRNDFHMLACS